MNRTGPFDVLLDSGFTPQPDQTPHFSRQLDRLLTGEVVPEVFFQPIVDLRRGVVTGYEALSRFPSEMNLSPDVFFQRAGRLGRRMELEHLMCSLVLGHRSRLPRGCFLTMNLGPDYLLSERWLQLLSEQMDLSGVVIEITEETSISSYDEIRERSSQIRAMGGLVAVDDAGSGYASLQHILELRPDFIKLNRNFVKDCHLDRAKSTMVEMMGAAADRLDAWIIAEGVESQLELEELIRIGVPLAQGFLLAKPEQEMRDIPTEVAETLWQFMRGNRHKTLEPHLIGCEMSLSVEAAERQLRRAPEASVAVVLDRWKRPQQVLERHPLVGIRQLETFSRTQVSNAPKQVLYRALARPVELRFDPIAVVNNDGECLGVVTIDRLMASMLTLETQRPAS